MNGNCTRWANLITLTAIYTRGIYQLLTKRQNNVSIITTVAERSGVPLEEIYGVATFYSQFALTPKGKYDISVCLGTACYVRGAQEIVDKISEILDLQPEDCTPDGRFSLTECRCIGACGLAPVMTINEDVYGRLTADEIPDILAKYMN